MLMYYPKDKGKRFTMAGKSAVITKKSKFGRKADPELAKAKKGGDPVVIFLPKVLRSRLKIACMALGTPLTKVCKELLEEWVVKQKKAIAAVVNMDDISEDEEEEDVDTTEDADEDEDTDEDEDEDED